MNDGGYAIIYANTTNSTDFRDPFSPQGGVYAIFIPYNKTIRREPVVLYQTQVSRINFTAIDCDIAYVGVGQTCILTGKFLGRTVLNVDTFYIKVAFLSSGTVYNVKSLNSSSGNIQYNIASLRYGGYLLSITEPKSPQSPQSPPSPKSPPSPELYIRGYVFSDDEPVPVPWNLTNPTRTNFRASSKLLPNNTFVLAQHEEGPSWSLITTDLRKFSFVQGKITQTRKKLN